MGRQKRRTASFADRGARTLQLTIVQICLFPLFFRISLTRASRPGTITPYVAPGVELPYGECVTECGCTLIVRARSPWKAGLMRVHLGGGEVLERRQNYLSVMLSLLLATLAGKVSVAAGQDWDIRAEFGSVWTGRSSCAFTDLPGSVETLCGESLASVSADFLAPPSRTLPSVSTFSYLRLLPAVPKPVALVLVGFLSISIVRDRKSWVAAVAFLLSLGHCWLSMVQPNLWRHRQRRLAPDVSSCGLAPVPVPGLAVICCGRNKPGFAQLRGVQKPRRFAPAAAMNPSDSSRCHRWRGTLVASQRVPRFAYLTFFPQLARGPPRRSQVNAAPTFSKRRVGAQVPSIKRVMWYHCWRQRSKIHA